VGIFRQLNRIEEMLEENGRKIDRLLQGDQELMGMQEDLDAALAQQGTDITALTTAVTSIETKLANVPNAPDISKEIATLKSYNAAIETVTKGTAGP